MQDGRALRRYQKRWIVEGTIGWLGNFRRLVVRYDRSLATYRAVFHIAYFMIVYGRLRNSLYFSTATFTTFSVTFQPRRPRVKPFFTAEAGDSISISRFSPGRSET